MALTNKQKEQYIRGVQNLINKWVPILGLQNYEIRLAPEDMPDHHMQMSVGWEPGYRRVTFTLNTDPEWPEMNLQPDVIEHAVVHELTHILLGPLQDFAYAEFDGGGSLYRQWRLADEQATDTLARVILRLGDKYTIENNQKAKRTGRPTAS